MLISFLFTILILLFLGILLFFLMIYFFKNTKPILLSLLGINLTLTGGILLLLRESETIGVVASIIMVLGLLLTFYVVIKNN
ncbi:hypothetical protein [Sutcliffiella halmapala]|uniref:hypothetical protein n=1 Tax=Sutcliffiella halmapala TaxID=79882 RepID=UPI0009954EEB|nr:hypothetical protein [Sutcliffiella halmapala]